MKSGEEPPPAIAGLRLEAIFHPKFENETPDSEIRERMLANVSESRGYLEASLKHSGSLLLWSGDQRFYSKNSADNAVTRVGEILLLRHFARCFGRGWEDAYARCAEHVSRRRLTCSFEVVTSVLGHHGDLPERDYLVLIAVADRRHGRGRFHSTEELVRFAQRFRLPHNDAWMFASGAACESLFVSYDAMRETGTAASVIKRLDEIAKENGGGECAKVASLCPHDVFQGDILEGIVIRYVPYGNRDEDGDVDMTTKHNLDAMKELGSASQELLRLVPPSTVIDKTLWDGTGNPRGGVIPSVDLRALAALDDFEEQVEAALRRFHGKNLRKIHSMSGDRDGATEGAAEFDVGKIAGEILSADANVHDGETLRIARLIQILGKIKVSLSYKLLVEENAAAGERYICILHVRHDASFQKYHSYLRDEGGGGMMLFRGFSIELVPAGAVRDEMTDDVGSVDDGGPDEGGEEKLMLKMKFLPYMVRTFVCRNGLSVLRDSGDAAFMEYAAAQFVKWGMSKDASTKWMPFFAGWAKYCSSPSAANSPTLIEKTYLYHFDEFDKRYANGEFRSSPSSEPSFRGTIILVGPSENDLETLCVAMSKELNCSKTIVCDPVDAVLGDGEGSPPRSKPKKISIAEKNVLLSMINPGGGLICSAGMGVNYGKLKSLAKQYHEVIYIVMVDGDLGMIPNADQRRQGWRNIKCKMLLDLPEEATAHPDVDTSLEYLRTDPVAKLVMGRLKDSCAIQDKRPGLIVYFPSIPGSGKSSLCQNVTQDTLGIKNDRQLILLEGDQLGKKFHSTVEREVLFKPASVAILDKNVPPKSFSLVHGVCTKSKSIALSVFSGGMEDTLVGDGTFSYAFPFSLQYLAVCMSRVLRRKPKSHKGKLDSGEVKACMVVAKFYCFYRNMTVLLLKEKLLSIGIEGKAATIPFFRESPVPDLPPVLKATLEDAIMLQTYEDKKIRGVSDEDIANMEARLRSTIGENQNYIDELTVPLEESKLAFLAELSRAVASLPDEFEGSIGRNEPPCKHIRIVSLDLDFKVIHTEIGKLQDAVQELQQYFHERMENKDNDENDKTKDRFITSAHCTFAHESQLTQAAMVSEFQHLLGTAIEVKVESILFSEKIAAFELEIPSGSSIPRPQNEFSHVTIWCSKGTEAHEANMLPEQVKSGQARRIDLEHPICMKGVFSFWYSPNES